MYGDKAEEHSRLHIRPTRDIIFYNMLLFGGSTSVSLAIYIYSVIGRSLLNFIKHLLTLTWGPVNVEASARSVGFLLVLGLFIYAFYNYLQFRRAIQEIDQALRGRSSSIEVKQLAQMSRIASGPPMPAQMSQKPRAEVIDTQK